LGEPALDWQDLHQVVPECDSQNGDRRHIQHWVELDELTNAGDAREVLVEAIRVWLAGELLLLSCVLAFVGQTAESIPR